MVRWLSKQRDRLVSNGNEPWRRLWPWALVFAVVFIVLAVVFYDNLPSPRNAGYPGIFLLNLIASGGLVIPAPGLASTCFGTSALGLDVISVGLLAATAETIGELTGYLAGVGGRNFLDRLPLARLRRGLEAWVQRRGGLVILVVAAIPNPIFDVVGIAAGSLRYPLPAFLGYVFLGKCVKDLAVAYACLHGMDNIVRFFGMG